MTIQPGNPILLQPVRYAEEQNRTLTIQHYLAGRVFKMESAICLKLS